MSIRVKKRFVVKKKKRNYLKLNDLKLRMRDGNSFFLKYLKRLKKKSIKPMLSYRCSRTT